MSAAAPAVMGKDLNRCARLWLALYPLNRAGVNPWVTTNDWALFTSLKNNIEIHFIYLSSLSLHEDVHCHRL